MFFITAKPKYYNFMHMTRNQQTCHIQWKFYAHVLFSQRNSFSEWSGNIYSYYQLYFVPFNEGTAVLPEIIHTFGVRVMFLTLCTNTLNHEEPLWLGNVAVHITSQSICNSWFVVPWSRMQFDLTFVKASLVDVHNQATSQMREDFTNSHILWTVWLTVSK